MSELLLSPEVIETERLRLRGLRPSDAALLTLYASDARVAKTTTDIPHPFPPGYAEAYVERVTRPGSRDLAWAIDTGAADEGNGLIGRISLRVLDDGRAELAYWIAPAFWGAGYATEAVRAVTAYADARGIGALVAQVLQDNERAARALTRAGFVYLGEGEIYSVGRAAMVPTFRYRREAGSTTR
ncbi:GNAT family N-acetyltransferase [Amaricoccus solimangrovi]|uniref:GNAT family N-acetyltransferase n=1 Tax=Amaricoccus solimangrovi TaxID=2589815 RepID=A0A501WQ33_9RHOB|nr:GNAT family N-acetyltransferase [Amaricoccus solimangrovi]TPE51458.1 GNAT family N-acetyltransferase [Amaricoccus solimangrovi]